MMNMENLADVEQRQSQLSGLAELLAKGYLRLARTPEWRERMFKETTSFLIRPSESAHGSDRKISSNNRKN